MNCKTCRSHLSDLLERTLPEPASRKVRDHLSRCTTCDKELRGLRATVRALRFTPTEVPPPGLEKRILENLATAAPEREGDRGRRGLSGRLTAAAAALLALLLGLLAGYRGLSTDRTTWKQEMAALERRLKTSSAAEQRAERGLRLVVEAKHAELSNTLAATAATVARQNTEIAALSSELLAAQKKIVRLDKIDPRERFDERNARDPRDGRDGMVALSDASEPEPSLRPDEAVPAAASVRFQRRGDRYVVDVAGPLEQVVPRLLAVATDNEDKERATLALGALENLLGPDRPAGEETGESVDAETPWPGEFLQPLHHSLGGFARRVGLLESREDLQAAASLSSYDERVRRVKQTWNGRRRG